MGAWSETIMGGDTPMDIEYTILEKLGFSEDDDELTEKRFRKALVSKQDKLLKFLQSEEITDWAEGEQLLVLGFMMVSNGAKMNDKVKTAVLQACDEDEWAQLDDKRKFYVNQLKEAVERNSGVPEELKSEGLFEKLAERLKQNEKGLINL